MKITYIQDTALRSCCPPDDKSIELCREYIKDNNLSLKDVKIAKTKSCVMVKVREGREVTLEGREDTDVDTEGSS